MTGMVGRGYSFTHWYLGWLKWSVASYWQYQKQRKFRVHNTHYIMSVFPFETLKPNRSWHVSLKMKLRTTVPWTQCRWLSKLASTESNLEMRFWYSYFGSPTTIRTVSAWDKFGSWCAFALLPSILPKICTRFGLMHYMSR